MNPFRHVSAFRGTWLGPFICFSCLLAGPAQAEPTYYPPPDSEGGWRKLETPEEVRHTVGMDVRKLDEAFHIAEASTKHGGLLVVRNGWLVYERYFGYGHRDATPNLASCGKSFTSVAVGILIEQRPDLFPQGLDQQVFASQYLPPVVFPLSDPRKADVKLGQLLAFSAGVRGNNPSQVLGDPVTIDPPGPDGWQAMVDAVAAGQQSVNSNGRLLSAESLWCEPGAGYSYATASAHLASMMVRHISGMELEQYLREHLAEPMGWGPFTYGYQYADQVRHTPGGGGIAVRATDMLRFGYLLLREGRWGEQQLVPAQYVRHCRTQSPYNPHAPYSLQFDVNTRGEVAEYPRDAFWKSGSGGHMLYVVPSLDLVVWKLGGRDGQYQRQDTGIPLPDGAADRAKSRASWRATLDLQQGQRQLLTKVIAAIEESDRPGRQQVSSQDADSRTSDLYLPGQIIVAPDNPAWLVYNRDSDGDGRLDPFFMCGPGGPEGFLYDQIAGGDSWEDVLDKMAAHGGNCIYMCGIRSHGGDGLPTHNPFINHDPAQGLDTQVLDRWEQIFQRMEENKIVIFFLLFDDDVELSASDEVTPIERDYIHGIVNRFEHHPNLVWCIAEEYSEGFSKDKLPKLAAEIRSVDDHRHIIANHQLRGTRLDFPDDEHIDQFAMQIGAESPADLHEKCIQAWNYARGRYHVNMSESYPYYSNLLLDGQRQKIRQSHWAAATAGNHVMHVGTWETHEREFSQQSVPTAEILGDYRRVSSFMESISDLAELAPKDELVTSGTAWVLGKPGHYISYLAEGGRITLDLSGSPSTLQAEWYDPRTGQKTEAARVEALKGQMFTAPDEEDWVLHLKSTA